MSLSPRHRSWFLLFLVFLAALLPRVADLDAFLSPDEPRWHQNTLGFRDGLRSRDLSKLYQQAHPGITTMWLELFTVSSESWGTRRLPQAAVIAVLVAVATWMMIQLWGNAVGAAAGLMIALNPGFIGHSRVLAMDALLSIFLVLAVLSFLLWIETRTPRTLVISGVSTALAILSKLGGVVIVGFFAAVLLWLLYEKKLSLREAGRVVSIWVGSMCLALVLVFPTLITHTRYVLGEVGAFFKGDLYRASVHSLGPWWYLQAVLIWSVPLHLLALVLAPMTLLSSSKWRQHMLYLLSFAALFFLSVQISIKKGDRYLLPAFLILDIVAVLILALAVSFLKKSDLPGARRFLPILLIAIASLVGWQLIDVVRLHPHVLAYRNPFFRHVADGRSMGWGEGLDLAAEYLNVKPNAERLLVASYYESSFDHRFRGFVTSAERLEKETPGQIGADYVVLYRTMEGRAPDRWETRVLEQFAAKKPEQTIVLNGEEYAWIYKMK